MLNRLPSGTGSFEDLLADLGLSARDTPRIARALGVSERTVWRWKKTQAPRMALLALWWLSRDGHSAWDCEMFNRTQLALAMNDCLVRSLDEAKTKLARLGQISDFGSANDPTADLVPNPNLQPQSAGRMAALRLVRPEREPPFEASPRKRRTVLAHVVNDEGNDTEEQRPNKRC